MATPTLDEYVKMAAAVTGVPEAEHARALGAVGADPARWSAALAHFTPRHSDPQFGRDYAERFRRALEAQVGPVEIDFERYCETAVMNSCGVPFDQAARAVGLSTPQLYVAGFQWNDKLGREPHMLAIFTAKVRIGKARHDRGARPLPPPKPATHVSALRCPRCGAPKVTMSRTAYVYCDYCALLFDYDFDRAEEALGGLPLGEVIDIIRAVVLPEIRAARQARNDARWHELWTWVYRTEMQICPETYSPRVGDSTYATAMAEWSARTSVVRALEPRIGEASEQVANAWRTAIHSPSARNLVKYARACVAQADVTAEIWTAHGLFDTHPDQLDAQTQRRLELKQVLRECLPNADDQARAQILELAGIDLRLQPVAPVDLQKTTCSHCGGALLLAPGAKHLLCEACGDVLDPNAPRFPCPQCGAAVIAAKPGELACGWCSARFDCV